MARSQCLLVFFLLFSFSIFDMMPPVSTLCPWPLGHNVLTLTIPSIVGDSSNRVYIFNRSMTNQ